MCVSIFGKQGFSSMAFLLLAQQFAWAQTEQTAVLQLRDFSGTFTQKGHVLSSSDSVKAKYHFLNALRDRTRNDIKGTIKNCLLSLSINSDNDAAYYELAKAYQTLGDYEQALVAINRAIVIREKHEWYFRLKGELMEQLGDFEGASSAYAVLTELRPDSEDYALRYGAALTVAGRTAEALSIFASAEKNYGFDEDLVLQRQKVYLKTGDLVSACREMDELIKRKPDELKYYLMAAELYMSNDMSDKAYLKYQQARKVAPDNGYLHLSLADYYKSKGDMPAVTKEIKKAFLSDELDLSAKTYILYMNYVNSGLPSAKTDVIALSGLLLEKYPQQAKVYAIRGDMLFADNQFKESCVAYRQALQLNPKSAGVWKQLVQAELLQQDFTATESVCLDALQHYPEEGAFDLFSGISKLQLGRTSAAIDALKAGLPKAAQNQALSTQLYATLGDAYHALGQHQASDDAYDRVLERDANNTVVLNNYAYYLSLRRQNLAKAERMSRRTNQLEPDNISYEDTYAWVLYGLGRYDEAKLWLEKAIKNNPSPSATLMEHYGDILFKLGDKAAAVLKWKAAKQGGGKSEYLDKKINDEGLEE